jgi:hypothetical protein
MSIVSSTVTVEHAQIDGRRWARETHTDHLGVQHIFDYLSEVGADTAAILSARAAGLPGQLAAQEISQNIQAVKSLGSLASPTFQHSTAGANAAALREAYGAMAQQEAIMTGDYLNTLTNGQLAAAFGITTGQAQTLRTNKMAPAAAVAASIRAEAG